MPNRSLVDQTLPSSYTAEATLSAPVTLAGASNAGADAIIHFVCVKTGAAGAVATLFDSDDGVTYAAVADPSFIVPQNSSDLDLSTAGVKTIGYVGPKPFSAVRVTGGNPVLSTFAVRQLLSRTVKATVL